MVICVSRANADGEPDGSAYPANALARFNRTRGAATSIDRVDTTSYAPRELSRSRRICVNSSFGLPAARCLVSIIVTARINVFIGHFGLAFAVKRVAPRTSLGATFAAAQLADLFWPIFLLLGAEQVRIAPKEHNPFLKIG